MKGKTTLILLLFALAIRIIPAQESSDWRSLYDLALRNNASLAEGENAARAAQNKWKSARQGRGPELFFESDLSYLTNPRQVDLSQGSLYAGGTLAPGLIFPPLPESETSLPLTGNQWYSFRLVLEQPLITSGKLSAQENIYRSLWESSLLNTNQKKLTVKAEILSLIHTLTYLEKILDIVSLQITAADRFVTLIRRSYDSGMTSHSDYLGAQVKAREVTLMENQIRKQQNQALLHLEYLCGLESLLPEQINPEGLPDLLGPGETDKETLLTDTRAYSPVLQILRQNIEAAKQNKRLTQGGSYGRPDLGFQVELDYAGGSFPFTSEEWGISENNVTATVGIRALLGDFGKAASLVKEAESRISEAEYRYRDHLEQMKRSIGEELFNQHLNRENIAYYNSQADDDMALATLKKESLDSGYGLEQDYLLQMISWYSDLIYIEQEKISLALSHYRLRTLTGVLPE
jgi:outer membrane protein TolC